MSNTVFIFNLSIQQNPSIFHLFNPSVLRSLNSPILHFFLLLIRQTLIPWFFIPSIHQPSLFNSFNPWSFNPSIFDLLTPFRMTSGLFKIVWGGAQFLNLNLSNYFNSLSIFYSVFDSFLYSPLHILRPWDILLFHRFPSDSFLYTFINIFQKYEQKHAPI